MQIAKSRKDLVWRFLVAAVVSAAFAPAVAQDYCARQPPPEGLVKRCHSKTIPVPPNEDVLRVQLLEWMATCVIADRAVQLVYSDEATASIDRIWSLLRGRYTALPSATDLRYVTVIPRYEPLRFTSEGRTCFGVKSVTFDLKGSRGSVDIDEVSLPSQDDLVKEAASAALQALLQSGQSSAPGFNRVLNVVEAMSKLGQNFDATYFPVAPFSHSNMEYAACFKDHRWQCMEPQAALKACEHNLGQELVVAHFVDRLSPQALADFALTRGTEILRGRDYMETAKNADNRALFCPAALVNTIMPKVQDLARKHGKRGIYGYY